MADNKCYTVVEFQKWKSHSEIVNKNNHNFRVNPVAVLKPEAASENDVLAAPDASTKERWIGLVKILETEMKKTKEKSSSIPIEEYKRYMTGNMDLRQRFIEKAAEAGYSIDDKHARDMISLAAEGIDLKRCYDNQSLAGGRTNFIDQFNDKLASHGITKVRKNAVMEIGVVMKVTKGFEKLPEGFDLEKWKADSMRWLEEKFGKDNILSAVYHADEFTPHIQASIIPITDDGRLSSKDFLPDWTAYSEAQDTYYEAVKQDGLYRGVKGTQPGFEDQRRAHNALVAAGDIELPEPDLGETTEEYHKRANEAFKESGMQAHLKAKESERERLVELSKIQDQADKLRAAVEQKDKEIKSLRDKTRSLISENSFYREQLQGSGATTRELKDAAAVAAKLKAEYESVIKDLKIKETHAIDKAARVQKENSELKQRVEMYDKIIKDGGLSPTAVNNNMLINYISYAFEHGYPRTQETKAEMQAAYKFGKEAKDRITIRDRDEEDI